VRKAVRGFIPLKIAVPIEFVLFVFTTKADITVNKIDKEIEGWGYYDDESGQVSFPFPTVK
jgi:hypothetical protein